jgi:hypothetical protein
MAQKKSLRQWLEGLSDSVTAVRVRVGGRSNPATVAIVALSDHGLASKAIAETEPYIVGTPGELVDAVEAEALAAGWPEEQGCETLRCHALTGTGKQVSSFQKSSDVRQSRTQLPPEWGVIDRLVSGYLEMGGELRRSVQVLSDTLQKREEAYLQSRMDAQDSDDAYFTARLDAQDAELQALASEWVQHELEATEPEESGISGVAANLLEQVASTIAGQRNGMDATSLRDILENDPSILDALVQDDELCAQVLGAWQARRAAAPEGDQPDPGEENATPDETV